MDYNLATTFDRGGFCHFGMTEEQKIKLLPFTVNMHEQMHEGREGFRGWIGHGGSVMQWHPESKVSIGYVPFDFLDTDYCNKRGKELQEIVMAIVKAKAEDTDPDAIGFTKYTDDREKDGIEIEVTRCCCCIKISNAIFAMFFYTFLCFVGCIFNIY